MTINDDANVVDVDVDGDDDDEVGDDHCNGHYQSLKSPVNHHFYAKFERSCEKIKKRLFGLCLWSLALEVSFEMVDCFFNCSALHDCIWWKQI